MIDWIAVLAILSPISAMLVAWMSWGRTRSRDAAENGASNATILVQLGHIKEGNDDIKGQLKDMKEQQGNMRERITSVEASAKQAHKRLDHIEGKASGE